VLDRLHELARLVMKAGADTADVVSACSTVADVLAASDAYVIRSGDPHFVRLGCPCSPTDYEIKQKGYWLIWREVAARPDAPAGLFDVEDRIVLQVAAALGAGRPATHLAVMLPSDESNSELLVVRGPWPNGLTEDQARFVEVARPMLAQLVSNVLDAQRQRRQRAQLESLTNVARAFSEAREDERVLDNVATALAKASGFDWVTLNVYDDECRRTVESALNFARHSETDTAQMFRDGRWLRGPEQQTPAAGELLGVQLARQGGPALFPDALDPSLDDAPNNAPLRPYMPLLRKYYERAHVLSVSMFPIVFQDRVIGDLSFSASTRHTFESDEVQFLQALVSQAATTIKGTRLVRDLERSRDELRQSEERFRALVQNASDLVTVIGADTTVTYQSPSIERVLGHKPEHIVGTRLADLIHVDDVARTLAALNQAMGSKQGQVTAEARVRHRDGSWRHVEFIGTDQFDNPAIGGFVLNIRDVTERKLLEQQLRHQALHDPLTRLANRTRFSDRLEHALLRNARTGHAVAVLFMDLDNFKGVNDSLGHSAGDALLTQVAERVQACIRPVDTVARLGGDEFAILLEDVRGIDDATTVTDRIFEALDAPFQLEGKELVVRASVGIAVSNGSASDAESLLRNADVAMYVAKSAGKGCYRVFEPSMQVSMMERLELLADLQRAIERDEFVLQYQPMVLLQTGELFGVEALVRWRHPRRGMMPPSEFIPLAEESGAILPLGRWVLSEACRQAREWQERFPAQATWTMSVNVSVKQLQDATFVDDVARILAETAITPQRLILEITESVMMHDVGSMMRRLHALKELGVKLAIDDFGTGYSSLSYLREFPFDMLKIDKSFIDDVGQMRHRKELTKAIIELGKTLDLELVAEGIEHSEQLTRLQSLECELGQGFLFAQPMDAVGVDALLESLTPKADAA
jgi:diguanylate cyclase (GGDEF)-like protein/PAS domain S-box-containing protein